MVLAEVEVLEAAGQAHSQVAAAATAVHWAGGQVAAAVVVAPVQRQSPVPALGLKMGAAEEVAPAVAALRIFTPVYWLTHLLVRHVPLCRPQKRLPASRRHPGRSIAIQAGVKVHLLGSASMLSACTQALCTYEKALGCGRARGA